MCGADVGIILSSGPPGVDDGRVGGSGGGWIWLLLLLMAACLGEVGFGGAGARGS